MANTVIQVKKSGTSGNVPASLNLGELALNYADGKLYYKTGGGTTAYIYSPYTFGTINANSTLILASSNTDTLSITSGNNIIVTGNSTTKTVNVALSNLVSLNYNTPSVPNSVILQMPFAVTARTLI